MKNISELRQDLVTGDWVVVATGRARRPDEFARRARREKPQSKSTCPFERLMPNAVIVFDRFGASHRPPFKDRRKLERKWRVAIVPNKYPAFGHGSCAVLRKVGPYRWQDGVGFHDVVITRDHKRSIAGMSNPEVASIIRAYRERYLELKKDDCIRYVSIFHNHGREAGATISHPHSQIIALPVIPPDVARSLSGSAIYFGNNHSCVHCAMISHDKKDGQRVVYENREFIALCPFVSRSAFEVRIFPRLHRPAFETIKDSAIPALAEVLGTVTAKLAAGLNHPAYNFFIHTAPVSNTKIWHYYHWHIEIVPKTAIWAGFEIGTGIEISTISPEAAAGFLRKIKT